MKKLLSLLFVSLLAFAAMAQAKSTGLTDDDVTSFCKNYKQIDKELSKLSINANETESLNVDAATIQKAEKILNKYGISGKQPFDKFKAIVYGYAIEYYDYTISKDPEAAKAVKAMGIDPTATIKPFSNEEDRKIVKKHLKELSETFGNDY